MTRRAAFDPHRLDDIDDLLPPVPAMPPAAPESDPEPSAPSTDAGEVTAASAAEPDPPPVLPSRAEDPTAEPPSEPSSPGMRAGRGRGGRPRVAPDVAPPPAAAPDDGDAEVAEPSRVQVPVRIAPSLYQQVNAQLLAGPERPSYGQLVVWACEDHPDLVAAEVTAARPPRGTRRPRGRRLAVDSVQVTLRLTGEERAELDRIVDRIREAHPGLVTRTEVAAAALRCSLRHPPLV